MKQPTKAIICAAGLGTRFLPQTKAMPKEMLPIIDRPVIQLIVEEAVAAGVTDVIIVTGSNKRAIEDHFDHDDYLDAELRAVGKETKADQLKDIASMANFIYVRQKGLPKGNARPVMNAAHLIDHDEPFYVFFADDFFRSEVPRAMQLRDAYERTGKAVISLIEVPMSDADKYGMVALGGQLDERTYEVAELIEKPGADKAPSSFASVGGYLLTPDFLPLLESLQPGKGGELTLADAINDLAKLGGVTGQFIEGTWHDTGDQLKYMQAIVDMALESAEYSEVFAAYLRKRLQ